MPTKHRQAVLNRREFLQKTKRTTLGMAAGVTILANAASVRGAPAAEKILLAAVGVRGRGANLAAGFLQRGGCEYAYICDPDTQLFESRAKQIAEQQGGKMPKCVKDFREALEDKSLTAIVSATPDHWHALSTVWACQAEKDVYVEKPPTHNCWEGQKMVEAARKYKRIVQVGTQNRSAAYNMSAKKYIDEGKLGDIHLVKVFNMKLWANRPPVPDSDPPPGLDWDLWNGPAPACRYNAAFHNYWHHLWRYSGGDIANDASHQIDLARWLVGAELPQKVYSTGGRWNSEGVAETPDTQVAVWEYPKMLIVFELTLYTPYMLKISPQIRESLTEFPYWPQCATRIEIYGSKGLMIVGRHGGGWQVFDRPIREKPQIVASDNGRFPDPEHQTNFLQCIRTRETPNADILEGHRSALLIHYANISYRLGGVKLTIDPKTELITDPPEAMKLFRREYRKPYEIPEQV